MNWLSIIIGLIQLILGRIQPAPSRTSSYSSYESERCRELAEAIAAQKPGGRALTRHEVSVLAAGLPGFLDDIIALLPKDFLNKSLGCAVAALLTYFQSRDIGSALSQFISCTIGGVVVPPPGGGGTNPPPGDGDNPPPGGGGGIDPTKPVLRDVPRCS